MSTAATRPHRILVVDDEPDLRTLYEITLVRAGYHVHCASDLESARAALATQSFDLLITDMRLPDGMGLALLEDLQSQQRSERSIVITAYGSAENAVRALKAGAFDYLTKPVNLDQFRRVVAAALRAREPAAAASEPTQEEASTPAASGAASVQHEALERMIGNSAAMRQLKATLLKVAPGMAPVLVLGESGSGKELVARALHACSHRASGPFVAVNCGAIPENLLEAEFFGAKKGAYTGSVADREGFFQSAHGGTLFLDEIGDLPLPMQAKLLRVIQERVLRPLGAQQEIAVDVRIVSATHRDLASMVQSGSFRQDLYYRLNVIDVRVPPLRERREDIPALCAALLVRISAENASQAPAMTPAFMHALQHMPLMGNVRELENTLHRCWALSDGHSLDDSLLHHVAHPAVAAPASETPAVQPSPHTQPDLLGAPAAQHIALPCDLQAFLDAHERALLLRALNATGFNRTAAAALLGLNLRQIRYRIERLGIAIEAMTE